MTSVVATINNEIQALRALKATKDGELQACKTDVEACKTDVEEYKARVETLGAQLKVCIAVVPNGRAVQVSAALKGNAQRPLAFHRARSARKINTFYGDLRHTLEQWASRMTLKK